MPPASARGKTVGAHLVLDGLMVGAHTSVTPDGDTDMTAATHTIVTTAQGFGIQRLASGSVYGQFDTWADAMMALAQSGLARQIAVSSPLHY